MLSKEKNELLIATSKGTPMGEFLRRYWHPIAGVSEFDTSLIKPMRLFGEDLVLYRDLSGNYGLLDRHCVHRRASLQFGYVEDKGIRCAYHGWKFEADGKCSERPYEDTAVPDATTRAGLKITSYPVRVAGGMLWTYMGPIETMPELPVWEPFNWQNGFCQIVTSVINCNWLQCQENSIDPIHFEWQHSNYSVRRMGGTKEKYVPRHTALDFTEFEFGYQYKRQRTDTNAEHPLWTTGRVCLYPNGFFLGEHFEWRVPVDDGHTLSISWFYLPVPAEARPYVQDQIPTWESPVMDANGKYHDSHILNQDFMAWVGQGTIADRTKEVLGSSDKGVVMLRRRFEADLQAIAEGRDPKGLIRDPEQAKNVSLPVAFPDEQLKAVPREQWMQNENFIRHLTNFVFSIGQPPEVLRQLKDAIGVE
ncbi:MULTISPECIES: aromatic ring-hydroxylating dioxygenase subunit alpha [Paraburkholderia]|uniref:aromatic ring-hydroxylating dioxygenase subunit alpha n=1 Tax=Paraburkholderia TaxID=1822464 RepID=UPI00159172A3|nr:aromatic ring-hydroxylating dioxygenase subunit alpha [Paraburkholderia youngii]NUX54050.1 aromatic ring-hydroxylating dioxygenase subunit alpha [Paraburkholderia youngii]